MLEVLPAPDGVVALRISGRMDENDIERAIQAVEDALTHHERIALYAEAEIAGMSPGAFARDLRYGLGKLRELHRFPRVAVVTGQDWVRWIVWAEDRIFPQITIRVFTPAEREEALAWVSQPIPPLEAEATPVMPSIRWIPASRPDVLAFEVNGRIHRDDMRQLIAAFENTLRGHKHLRVLVRVLRFGGVSLEALREDGLAALKMQAWRQVERCALVGDQAWMAKLAQWLVPLVGVEIRSFDLDREDEAWHWLEAAPSLSQ